MNLIWITFFTGTITDYARLLKVGYLAARAADPQAQIVMGGLVHWQKPGWFSDLLDLIADRSRRGRKSLLHG